jgi:hypothetical protein
MLAQTAIQLNAWQPLPADHHACGMGEILHAFERVPVEQDEVGSHSLGDDAHLGLVEVFRSAPGRRPEDFAGSPRLST